MSSASGNTRKRKARRKDDKNPKRPMTAYNYFFQEERRRILSGEDKMLVVVLSRGHKAKNRVAESTEDKDGNEPMKISFQDRCRIIGQRWRDLDGEELPYYKEKAERDSQRYQQEMKRFYEKQVSAMCHCCNDPVPSSLFRCGPDDEEKAEGSTAAAEEVDIPSKRICEAKFDETTTDFPSPIHAVASLGAKKINQIPCHPVGARAVPDVPAAAQPGNMSPSSTQTLLQQLLEQQQTEQLVNASPFSAQALLQQLLEQQQKDQMGIAALLCQSGLPSFTTLAPSAVAAGNAASSLQNILSPPQQQHLQAQQANQQQQVLLNALLEQQTISSAAPTGLFNTLQNLLQNSSQNLLQLQLLVQGSVPAPAPSASNSGALYSAAATRALLQQQMFMGL